VSAGRNELPGWSQIVTYRRTNHPLDSFSLYVRCEDKRVRPEGLRLSEPCRESNPLLLRPGGQVWNPHVSLDTGSVGRRIYPRRTLFVRYHISVEHCSRDLADGIGTARMERSRSISLDRTYRYHGKVQHGHPPQHLTSAQRLQLEAWTRDKRVHSVRSYISRPWKESDPPLPRRDTRAGVDGSTPMSQLCVRPYMCSKIQPKCSRDVYQESTEE